MKSMPLDSFLRNYPLRGGEITRVAQSMDENELEVDVTLTTRVNGMEKFTDLTLQFVGFKTKEMPWNRMIISRCRTIGNAIEIVTDKNVVIEIAY